MKPLLRFPEFVNSWDQVTIGQAASFRRGSFPQPYNIPKWYDEINGMPFVQVVDVGNDFRLKPKTKQWISKLAMPKSVFVPEGSIVITIQGSIGRIALTQYDSYVDRTLLIITDKRIPLDDYFFVLALKKIFDYEKTIAVGGTIKTITKEKLSQFKFYVTHYTEQRKIGEFIKLVDQKINLLTKKKEALEAYKKGLMQKIFTQELRFKREDGTDYPEWKKSTLEDVFGSNKGKGLSLGDLSVTGKNRCLLYGSLYTKYNEIITDCVEFTDKTGSVSAQKNDLLVPASTTTSAVDLATFSCLLVDEVFIGGDVTILSPLSQQDSRWWAYYLSHYKRHKIAKYAQGSTIIHLYFKHFKKIDVCYPSYEEQKRIVDLLSSIDTKVSWTQAQIDVCQKQKKGLLQQMFV